MHSCGDGFVEKVLHHTSSLRPAADPGPPFPTYIITTFIDCHLLLVVSLSNHRRDAVMTTIEKQSADSTPIEEQVAKLDIPLLPERLDEIPGIRFVEYPDESQLDAVMSLVGRDLSEPYSSM